jgi:hypothetical protein
MIKVTETEHIFEIQSMMPAGQRIFLFFIALVPLLAPYELIIQPGWEDYFNVFFLFAVLISLGALTMSAAFIWASIAGMNSILRFNRTERCLIHRYGAPIIRWRTEEIFLRELDRLALEVQDWSEGGPSYRLTAILRTGRSINIGSSWSQEEIETIIQKANLFLRTIS